ncbi:MAG: aminotransferase [Rhodospirillaceae bacterium]|nr:aminotransferase [Rhodospirillaceae bacterium]|tara:strand:- start:1328 stop:2503 length:1176 start_codon:yes stop_codon:yes gene_type:complete
MDKQKVDKARRETRGCQNIIHFNNAGASLMPAPVADYLYRFLRDEEIVGGYETAAARVMEVENFYEATAKLLNARSDEIAFVENATRAWDMVFYALPLRPGDRILTTVSEYGSNLIAYLHRVRQTGAELIVIEDDKHGQIDTKKLQNSIDDRTKLISISHIPTGGGLVNPAREVGKIARRNGVPFLLDACQSVGQTPLDVEEIGCDFLSATGRKYLRGPRGTGLLYVRKTWIEKLEPPFIDQHAAELVSQKDYILRCDARRFENWERYFAGQAALGKAIDYAMEFGLENIQERVFELADTLREGLSNLFKIKLTDQGQVKCGIVTFQHQSLNAEEIKRILLSEGINVSVSSGSGMKLSYLQRGIDSLIRASLHYFNTNEEIAKFLAIISKL